MGGLGEADDQGGDDGREEKGAGDHRPGALRNGGVGVRGKSVVALRGLSRRGRTGAGGASGRRAGGGHGG